MPSMSFDQVRALRDVPVVVIDERSVIIEVNDAFVSAFGFTREQALTKPLAIIIPPTMRDAHNLGFARFLASGVSTILGRNLDLSTLDSAGREFPAEHYVVGEQQDGRWRFAASIKPRK